VTTNADGSGFVEVAAVVAPHETDQEQGERENNQPEEKSGQLHGPVSFDHVVTDDHHEPYSAETGHGPRQGQKAAAEKIPLFTPIEALLAIGEERRAHR
jgi:hypothetical protein